MISNRGVPRTVPARHIERPFRPRPLVGGDVGLGWRRTYRVT